MKRVLSLTCSLALLTLAAAPLLTAQDMEEAPAPAEADAEPGAGTAAPADAKAPAKKEKKPFQPVILSSKPGAGKVRLFILSGQSNMQGLDPSKTFFPTVSAAFPEDDVVVVRDAQSGQPIRRWLKDWKPAEGVEANAKAKGVGDLYERLKTSIATALEGKAEPASVVFVWMQGESDAKADYSANNYDESLKQLIALVRTDMKAPKMPVIVGKLSDHKSKNDASWIVVQQKQEEVAKADPLVRLVDTADLNGGKDGLHYDGPGYRELGQRFADAAVKALKE
jgi:hypothetical protein